MGNKKICNGLSKTDDQPVMVEDTPTDDISFDDRDASLSPTATERVAGISRRRSTTVDGTKMVDMDDLVTKISNNLKRLTLAERYKLRNDCPYFSELVDIVPKFGSLRNTGISIFLEDSHGSDHPRHMISGINKKTVPGSGFDFSKLCFTWLLISFLTLYTVSRIETDLKNLPSASQTFAKFWLTKIKKYDLRSERCVIEAPPYFADIFRPPVHCGGCAGIRAVPKVSHLTRDEFEQKYAYSLQPVVITDAQINWTARDAFTLEFFKGIYKVGSPVLDKAERSCQFFPYKTEFKNLVQVFNMKPERAQLEDGSKPWYVGWSNCDPEAANILRRYYTQPYFLPSESESSRTDWIFMGSPGYGAHMHIDHVGIPSWQAQIRGEKIWFLEPPPECYLTCKKLQVTVLPGETIVLDTNKWYHKTLVVGNEMSVVIGSEYD